RGDLVTGVQTCALPICTRILPPTEADDRVFQSDRRHARRGWERLRALPFAEQAALVESETVLQSWAMAELLCDESARATASSQEVGRAACRENRWVREV